MISRTRVLIGQIACAAAPLMFLANDALAERHHHAGHAPEIDGPAGIAAVALLVGAGLIAYRKFKK